MKERGEKIAMLTAYDAVFARLLADAGVDVLLVGDSLGMLVQGAADTLSVRLSETAYHVRCVRAGAPEAIVIGDMPFGTYQESPQRAYANATKLMAAGATMVKMEGGMMFAETIEFLTKRGIPVCAHAGLMPQWVRAQGGYKVRGRDDNEAASICDDTKALEEAGAVMLVLELVPAKVTAKITESLRIPVIGIGCGAKCDGQVLVVHDMLGMTGAPKRFVRNFMSDRGDIQKAVESYVSAVKSGEFPTSENAF